MGRDTFIVTVPGGNSTVGVLHNQLHSSQSYLSSRRAEHIGKSPEQVSLHLPCMVITSGHAKSLFQLSGPSQVHLFCNKGQQKLPSVLLQGGSQCRFIDGHFLVSMEELSAVCLFSDTITAQSLVQGQTGYAYLILITPVQPWQLGFLTLLERCQ